MLEHETQYMHLMNTYYMLQRCTDCIEHFSDISRKIRVSEKSPIATSTFQVSLFLPSFFSSLFRSYPFSVTFRDSRIFKGSSYEFSANRHIKARRLRNSDQSSLLPQVP